MKNVKKIVFNNFKWIMALVILILFIMIVVSLFNDTITIFDNFCYDKVSVLINDKMTFFVRMITNLGSAVALISVTILIMLFFKNKRYGIITGVNLIVVFLFNLLLKFIFARPRPENINLIEEGGYSFPSAHAMVSTAFYGFLIYLIIKSNLSKKSKIIYSVLFLILILFICLTRIYLGVHYASDVVGGALMAVFYLIIFTNAVTKHLNKIKKEPKF